MKRKSEKIRLALISGGKSGEHEISVRSAGSVRDALNSDKYCVSDFFIDPNGQWSPGPLSPEPGSNLNIDVVFPLLHGTFGEDGTIQGLLELAELPYVGAGVLSSAVAMDKAMTKRICRDAGLPVGPYIVLRKGSYNPASLTLPFGFPVFVKPANLGSSVGISKAKTSAELTQALEKAATYDRKILIEQAIEGREFECAVLGGNSPRASVPCEVLPSQDFYTFEDKYLLNQARIELPARLSPEQTAEMQRLAVCCFEAVECEGMARVDFLMDGASGQLYINEINTIPGFTSISMFPKMWEYSGLSYSQLLDTLIDLALVRS